MQAANLGCRRAMVVHVALVLAALGAAMWLLAPARALSQELLPPHSPADSATFPPGPSPASQTELDSTRPLVRWGPIAQKVDCRILQARDDIRAVRAARGAAADFSDLSMESVLKVSTDGRIHCYVALDQISTAHLRTLADLGFHLELAADQTPLIQGWAPADSVEQIAALSFVRRIEPPDYGIAQCVGAHCTQGDAILAADQLRTLGIDGTGVKVGVISNGASNLAQAVATGDLPSSVSICPTQPGNGNEGTAMLEIVHDLAPGARLYFASGTPSGVTSVEMISAINWMVGQGVNVIVDDMAFFRQPFFEDGTVANAARSAVQSGIVYCSSAGNYCGQHYQGLYTEAHPGGPDFFHDFDPGPSVADNLPVLVPAGKTIVVWLQWDDPFGASSNDYDLRLLDVASSAFVGTGGNDVQNGSGDPIEGVFWTNPYPGPAPRQIGIMIRNVSGSAAPRTLELFSLYQSINSPFASCDDSIFGHPAVPEVISCGAIDAADPGNINIESFSSRGPSTIRFPSSEIRPTPFCAAIDNVDVSGAGGFSSPFRGTSAAAPHAAGLAALLFDASGYTATPQQIRDALAAGAADRGPVGFDNTYGYGLLNAVQARDSLLAAIGLAAPTNVAASDGEPCDAVTVTWAPVAAATSYSVWRNTTRDFATVLSVGTTTATTLSDPSAVAGTLYYYWVQAINQFAAQVSGQSDSGFRGPPPQPPASLVASYSTDCAGVMLTWDPVPGADSYRIYRGQTSSESAAQKIAESNQPAYEDSSATVSGIQYYWVEAINACGVTGRAGPAGGLRASSPDPPQNVSASDGSLGDTIRVTWDASPRATSYTIWRSLANDGGSQIAEVAASPFDDNTAQPSTTYYYWVYAANICGISSASEADTGFDGAPPAPQPFACGVGGCGSGTALATLSLLLGTAMWRKHARR